MAQEQPQKKSIIPLVLVLGSFLALGVGLNLFTLWKWHHHNAMRSAPTVIGKVLGKYSASSTKGTPTYTVRYRYEVPAEDGSPRRHESSQNVEANIYQGAHKGHSITVHYLPGDPSESSLGGESPSLPYAIVACVVVDGLFVIFILRIIREEWKARRKRRTAPTSEG